MKLIQQKNVKQNSYYNLCQESRSLEMKRVFFKSWLYSLWVCSSGNACCFRKQLFSYVFRACFSLVLLSMRCDCIVASSCLYCVIASCDGFFRFSLIEQRLASSSSTSGTLFPSARQRLFASFVLQSVCVGIVFSSSESSNGVIVSLVDGSSLVCSYVSSISTAIVSSFVSFSDLVHFSIAVGFFMGIKRLIYFHWFRVSCIV